MRKMFSKKQIEAIAKSIADLEIEDTSKIIATIDAWLINYDFDCDMMTIASNIDYLSNNSATEGQVLTATGDGDSEWADLPILHYLDCVVSDTSDTYIIHCFTHEDIIINDDITDFYNALNVINPYLLTTSGQSSGNRFNDIFSNAAELEAINGYIQNTKTLTSHELVY